MEEPEERSYDEMNSYKTRHAATKRLMNFFHGRSVGGPSLPSIERWHSQLEHLNGNQIRWR
jgi:hypothetical protein